jgi:hypothetical protein
MADKAAVKSVSIGAGSLILIALIAWFFSPDLDRTNRKLDAIQAELKAIRVALQKRDAAPPSRPAAAAEAARPPVEAPRAGSGPVVSADDLQLEKPDPVEAEDASAGR